MQNFSDTGQDIKTKEHLMRFIFFPLSKYKSPGNRLTWALLYQPPLIKGNQFHMVKDKGNTATWQITLNLPPFWSAEA